MSRRLRFSLVFPSFKNLSVSSPSLVPEPCMCMLGENRGIDVPFGAEHSTDTCPLHFDCERQKSPCALR